MSRRNKICRTRKKPAAGGDAVRSIRGGRSEGRSAPVTSRYNDRSVCDVLRTGSYDRTIRTFERTLTRRYCVPSVVCIRIVREPLTQKSLEYQSLIGKRCETNDPGRSIVVRPRRNSVDRTERSDRGDRFVRERGIEAERSRFDLRLRIAQFQTRQETRGGFPCVGKISGK